MEVIGSFRVTKARMLHPNVQYALLLLEDRMLFIRIGGEFSDLRYLACYYLTILTVGSLITAIASFLTRNSTIASFSIGPGMLSGMFLGNVLVRRIRPNKKWPLVLNRLSAMAQEEALAKHKNNFTTMYASVTRIELLASEVGFIIGPRTGQISIDYADYDLAPGQSFDEIEKLIRALLPSKLKYVANAGRRRSRA